MQRRINFDWDINLIKKDQRFVSLELVINYRNNKTNCEYILIKGNNNKSFGWIEDPDSWVGILEFKFWFRLKIYHKHTEYTINSNPVLVNNKKVFENETINISKEYTLDSKKLNANFGTILVKKISLEYNNLKKIYQHKILDLYNKTPLLPIYTESIENINKVSATILWLNNKYINYKIKIKHILFENENKRYCIFYNIKKTPKIVDNLIDFASNKQLNK